MSRFRVSPRRFVLLSGVAVSLLLGSSGPLPAREPAVPRQKPSAPPVSTWQTFTSSEGAFSILFPGKYETKKEVEEDKAKGTATLTITTTTPGFEKSKSPFIYACIVMRHNRATIDALLHDLPPGKDLYRDIMIRDLSRSFLPAEGSKEAKAIKSDRTFVWNGFTAREWFLSSQKDGGWRAGRLRILAGSGNLVFLAVLAQSPRRIPPSALASAEKFFTSLHLSEMPASWNAPAPDPTPKVPDAAPAPVDGPHPLPLPR